MPRAGAFFSIGSMAAGCVVTLAAAPALAAPEFQGHLTGIVIAATLREAIFIEDGAMRRLHPGDTIEGWTLVAIEPDAVTLSTDGATTRLSPARAPSTETAAAAAPAPAGRTHQVSNALLRQQRDEAAAEAAMAAATAKMQAQQAARRGNRLP